MVEEWNPFHRASAINWIDLAAPLPPPAPASLMDGFVAGPDLFVKEETGLVTARFISTKSKRRPLHGRPSSKAKVPLLFFIQPWDL